MIKHGRECGHSEQVASASQVLEGYTPIAIQRRPRVQTRHNCGHVAGAAICTAFS